MKCIYPGPGVTDPDAKVRTYHPVLKQLDDGKTYDLPDEKAQLYIESGLLSPAPLDPPPAPPKKAGSGIDKAAKEGDEKQA
jgi:hypothetical protein